MGRDERSTLDFFLPFLSLVLVARSGWGRHQLFTPPSCLPLLFWDARWPLDRVYAALSESFRIFNKLSSPHLTSSRLVSSRAKSTLSLKIRRKKVQSGSPEIPVASRQAQMICMTGLHPTTSMPLKEHQHRPGE